MVGDFVETHTGTDNDHPQQNAAIALAKKTGAVLVVAKLDRLSRRVSFLASLMEEKGMDFKVAQMPYADRFQLHIYAALAEQERLFISQRTTAALHAAKARGVRLGAPVHHIDALAEAKKQYREMRTAGLRDAMEARKVADEAVKEELKNLGYQTSYSPFTGFTWRNF